MAGFVQIIEWKTSRFDEVRALNEEYRDSRQGEAGPSRVTVTSDRDRPGTYLTIVEFPDYDSAMANSARADTSEFAEKMGALCDGPPSFYNLDVQMQEEMG
ncbi:MAG: hypothetical protein QOK42_1061 [Frankiaceae bacterium]|jgi:quinol monooxygenase YgiN|nr:hypothetical protein [Frankiaceae bacterium]MDX6272843.1 hypothetical protein [Frankiales bacterium]